MAVTLGAGDSFHLIPRVFALCTDGLAQHAAALGAGKIRDLDNHDRILRPALLRLAQALQNTRALRPYRRRMDTRCRARGPVPVPAERVMSASAPLSWGIYRNIPFTALGVIIVVLFFVEARRRNDRPFRRMWLAITVSFACYIPVVLFADGLPAHRRADDTQDLRLRLGAVLIGYLDMKRSAAK
jgi:hypothetical protein